LQSGIAPFYEPDMIEYYMQTEKLSREEAISKVKVTYPLFHPAYDIYHIGKIYDAIFIDEVSRTTLKPPRYLPAYLIMFGDKGSNYSVYIPGRNNNAILSEYAGNNEASWVNLRFGKCRKIN